MSNEMEEFKVEINENLERAEQALLAFEALEDGQSSPVHYDEVFRTYHNIKGAAGMLEWGELQHHVHQLENVLMQTKASSSIPKRLIGWFLRGNDAIRSIMANEQYTFDYDPSTSSSPSKESEKAELEVPPGDFYTEVNESLERISTTLISMEKGVAKKEVVDALYRDIHSVKGACQLFGLIHASQLSHSMESSLEPVRASEQIELDPALVSTLLLSLDLMHQCLEAPESEDVQREVKFMCNLLEPFQQAQAVQKPVVEKKEPVQVSATSETEKSSDSSIRVQVSLLDRLMTLMGEMVLVRNQVLQYSNKTDDLEFLNLSQKLDVVTSELQEETMKTRMQPIGNVLSKFQRVVRDIASNLDKKINLVLHGVETELDKTLIEAVKDPLTHIVRNACDHGIESPEARLHTGKPECGTITVRAYHEGGQVVVDISDDGKGLSRSKLLKKAIEKGIIDPDRAEKMSDREVHYLIFAPGFSTADQVTNLSGRGVGMDVVKSNIERIGGVVELSSIEGEGTRIILKIPLTLAIVPAMIVRTENERFAIPQVKLVELVRIERAALEYIQGKPIFRLRGNLLPLFHMKEILSGEGATGEEAFNIVILNSENQLFGMIVDEILDTADIVVKPLPKFLKPISIYSGATVLGDGKVALIMDVQGIAQKHLGPRGEAEDSGPELDGLFSEEELREFVLVGLSSSSRHAIPLQFVTRMEEIRASSVEFSGSQRVIRYRNSILPLVNVNELLGYPEAEQNSEILQIIVTKTGDQLMGLEVNQIIDVYSSREFLDCSIIPHKAISGNLVSKDGIIVVLDVDKLVGLTRPSANEFNSNATMPRILLVEDTESIRRKLENDLISKGYEVLTAEDGIDGLKRIAENSGNFDVIISDIEMPRMNGFEFAKKVRTLSQMKNVPMIAFTTKNTPQDLKEAKVAGFSTYLEKSKGKLLPLLVQECLAFKKRKSA